MVKSTISFPQTIPKDAHSHWILCWALMSPTKFASGQNVLPLFPQVSPCCQFIYSDDNGIYWCHVSCMLKWPDVYQTFHHRKMSVITYSSHTGLIIRVWSQLFIFPSQWYPLCEYYPNTKTHIFWLPYRVSTSPIQYAFTSDKNIDRSALQQIDGQYMAWSNMIVREYLSDQ